MAASACPYCGNPIVVTGQFSGALKPDYVIPFKLDKKAAKAGLMRHIPEVPPSKTPYRSTDISSSGSCCQSGWHHHSTDTYIPVYFPYRCSPSLSFLWPFKGQRCLSTAALPQGQW